MVISNVDLADYTDIVPDERRRLLLYAAMEVIAKNTLENVTMDRIARQAGVTRVTLYREFGNRGALIEAVAAFRLMLFDEKFFKGVDLELSLSEIIVEYLVESAFYSKNNPVSRRWAGGGMKFLYLGSLIHRVSAASWAPIVKMRSSLNLDIDVFEISHWLIILQYSLGRVSVEADFDEKAIANIVRKFVSPAFEVNDSRPLNQRGFRSGGLPS